MSVSPLRQKVLLLSDKSNKLYFWPENTKKEGWHWVKFFPIPQVVEYFFDSSYKEEIFGLKKFPLSIYVV